MFDSLMVALGVVLPMAILMAIGAGTRAAGIIDRPSMKKVDALVFRLMMPSLLFRNIYGADIVSGGFDKEILMTVVSMAVIFLLAITVPKYLVKDPRQAASIGQAVFRPNYVLFGVAVTESIYGKGNAGITALVGAIVVPASNAFSVVLLELARNQKARPMALLRNVLKNPMVISAIAAISLRALDIRVPELIYGIVCDLADATTPVSFLSLGASLSLRELTANRRPLGIGLALRMLLLPVLFLPIAIALGFRGPSLCAMMILFAAPTAISSYPMAASMGADGPLAGQLVCGTTLVSVVTMFLLTLLLSALGLL